jgi:hypothetical protein
VAEPGRRGQGRGGGSAIVWPRPRRAYQDDLHPAPATITGGAAWDGTWSTLTLPADPSAGISLTVKATTAAIVKIQSGADAPTTLSVRDGFVACL